MKHYGNSVNYATITRHSLPVSKVTVKGYGVNERTGRQHKFSHHTAGYEPAGSMAHWTAEKWSISCTIDGARHGFNFSRLDSALDRFRDITGRVMPC